MNKVRYTVMVVVVLFSFVLSNCATPTPEVIVVTATPLPPTEPPAATPTQTLIPVSLGGPQFGEVMKWIDGSKLIYIPPSEFVMGNDGFDAPVHAVTLDGYWIQQTNVTNRMYAQCVAVGTCTPPTQELGGPVYNNPQYANHPVVGVNWDQAQTYCTWIQGSLPSEAQWEKAARGANGNLYPWGSGEPACDILNFGYCSGRTSEVDEFKEGASPYGLYDMAGNVYQWIFDWYDQNYYSNAPALNPMGPESGEYRAIRGSSFESEKSQLDPAIRRYGARVYHSRDLGFRCVVQQPQPIPPFCQTSAYIPTGAIVSNGCELPLTEVNGQYCANGNSFATVDVPFGAEYQPGPGLNCTEAIVDGQRILTCTGPKAQEATNPITVCNPACSTSASATGSTPVCESGYALDPSTGACNYAPIAGRQPGVAGCPVGYILQDRGGQQICAIGRDANGYCPAGTYYDTVAGSCVPPNGETRAPYGIDDAAMGSQFYANCAAGYAYSEAFQCCQAVTGGTYPGCPPGTTFNADLGACSPSEIKLSGPGCVTLDVTTLQCSQPVDVCSRITSEAACIRNGYACKWNEKDNVCQLK